MNNTLEIYLIRHTEPLIEAGTCYGQLDCMVNDDYAEQLAKISAYFNNKAISAIYTSPLQRCALLAEDLAEQHHVSDLIYKDALKEIHFGDWEGVKWDDIGRSKIEQWNENRLHFEFPNGESPWSFRQRVLKEYAALQSVPIMEDKAIIVVAHAGVIRTILSQVLNLSFSDSLNLPVDKASISLITSKIGVQNISFLSFLPST